MGLRTHSSFTCFSIYLHRPLGYTDCSLPFPLCLSFGLVFLLLDVMIASNSDVAAPRKAVAHPWPWPRRVPEPELEHFCIPRKCMESKGLSPGGGINRSPHNLAKIWHPAAGPPTERPPRPTPHNMLELRSAARLLSHRCVWRCTWRRLPSNLHCKHAVEPRTTLPQRHHSLHPPPSPSAPAPAPQHATRDRSPRDAKPFKSAALRATAGVIAPG